MKKKLVGLELENTQKLLDYLMSRPYKETAGLIAMIVHSPEIDAPEQATEAKNEQQ